MMGIAAGASAQNVADYRYFKNEGIFDPGVSDGTANALVRERIASVDPVVLDLTIRALGEFAMHAVNDLPTPYGSPDRSCSAIPELKPFLIEYWREQHLRSGYNPVAAIQQGLGLEGAEGLDGFTVAIWAREKRLPSTRSLTRLKQEPLLGAWFHKYSARSIPGTAMCRSFCGKWKIRTYRPATP